jgi:hypothetical protein
VYVYFSSSGSVCQLLYSTPLTFLELLRGALFLRLLFLCSYGGDEELQTQSHLKLIDAIAGTSVRQLALVRDVAEGSELAKEKHHHGLGEEPKQDSPEDDNSEGNFSDVTTKEVHLCTS